MFLHVSVILFVILGMCGRGHVWQGACMVGRHAWQRGVHGRGHVWQGMCMAGGHVWLGGACPLTDTTRYSQ